MLAGKGPHGRIFGDDIVRIHFVLIYTDIIECNSVGDKILSLKAPIWHSFPSTSMLKAGDIITTGQYMNYQKFST